MKRYSLIIFLSFLFLTGCTSKSNFLVSFDTFSINIYDNNKKYIELPIDRTHWEMNIVQKMKEDVLQGDTGFINSLLITKIAIQSWTNIKDLMTVNTKTLQRKLLQYTSITDTDQKVKCSSSQYSWYITTFSYQIDKQTFYDGQYFFIDGVVLYGISLASDDPKDIKTFIKSIGTIKCIN